MKLKKRIWLGLLAAGVAAACTTEPSINDWPVVGNPFDQPTVRIRVTSISPTENGKIVPIKEEFVPAHSRVTFETITIFARVEPRDITPNTNYIVALAASDGHYLGHHQVRWTAQDLLGGIPNVERSAEQARQASARLNKELRFEVPFEDTASDMFVKDHNSAFEKQEQEFLQELERKLRQGELPPSKQFKFRHANLQPIFDRHFFFVLREDTVR